MAGGIAAGNAAGGSLTLSGAAALSFLFFSVGSRFKGYGKAAAVFFVFFIFFCGFCLISLHLPRDFGADHVSAYTGKTVYTVSGSVDSVPEYTAIRTAVVLDDLAIGRGTDSQKAVKGRIRLYIYSGNKTVELSYGRRISFRSAVKAPRNFSNPGGFDYKKYLAFRDIWGIVYTSARKVSLENRNAGAGFAAALVRETNRLRYGFADLVSESVDNEKAAAVLTALTTGDRDGISDDLRDSFARSGAAHVLAISGLHMGVVAAIFYYLWYQLFSLFRPLLLSGNSGKAAAFATLVPLGFYAALSGFSPSTQRAFIMIVIFMFTFVIDREKDVFNSLAAAGIVILLISPHSLFSVSFQLSFTAVFFILMGVHGIKTKGLFQRRTPADRLFLFAAVSACATLGTLPVIIYYFNMVSFVQVFTNIVIIPAIGFAAVPIGLAAFFLFPVSGSVAAFLVKLAAPFLSFSVAFIEFIASLPFTWSRCVTPDTVELLCYYLAMAGLFLLFSKRRRTGAWLILIPLAVFVCHTGVVVKERYFNRALTVTVLDVGQGSSAFIRAPDGVGVLVDGGGFSYSSTFDTGRYIVAPFLWRQRFMSLDAVVLSHPEKDHMNGLVYIMENFDVKKFVKNGDERDTRSYADLMAVCARKGIEVVCIPSAEKETGLDPSQFHFLYPFSRRSNASEDTDFNNNSVVFHMRHQDFSMLFPGDIERAAETKIAAAAGNSLKADVLLSPHHGSATSSSDFFLDKVAPESVIISCGRHNRYGFPGRKVLARCRRRGITVYRTDLDGAVQVISDGQDHRITTYKGE